MCSRKVVFLVGAILLSLHFVSPTNCSAQSSSEKDQGIFSEERISLGIETGPRAAAFWGSDAKPDGVQKIESRTTFGIGLRMTYEATSRWSIISGVQYRGYGQRFMGVSEGALRELTLEIGQLRIPANARFRVANFEIGGRRFAQTFSAGPYVSIRVRSDQYSQVSGEEQEDVSPVDFRRVMWGGQLGAGLQTELWRGELGVRGSYEFGLRSVSSDGLDLKDQGLGVSVFYSMRLTEILFAI